MHIALQKLSKWFWTRCNGTVGYNNTIQRETYQSLIYFSLKYIDTALCANVARQLISDLHANYIKNTSHNVCNATEVAVTNYSATAVHIHQGLMAANFKLKFNNQLIINTCR